MGIVRFIVLSEDIAVTWNYFYLKGLWLQLSLSDQQLFLFSELMTPKGNFFFPKDIWESRVDREVVPMIGKCHGYLKRAVSAQLVLLSG